jgi:anti-anti-sigma regulatory factor
MLKRNNSSIDLTIDESTHLGLLKFHGPLTEKMVEELKKTMEASNDKVSYYKINLENVTAVDLSSIQSLYSTCETMGRAHIPLSIDGICPVIFTSAVENTGYSYHRWLCFGR